MVSHVRLEVLTAVVMKASVIWDISPYSPLKIKWHFSQTCHLHLQGWRVSQARNKHEAGNKQGKWLLKMLDYIETEGTLEGDPSEWLTFIAGFTRLSVLLWGLLLPAAGWVLPLLCLILGQSAGALARYPAGRMSGWLASHWGKSLVSFGWSRMTGIEGICSIPCDCSQVYVRQTGCFIDTSLKECHWHIRLERSDKLAVAEPSISFGCCIQLC
jgi:hypothetical protein